MWYGNGETQSNREQLQPPIISYPFIVRMQSVVDESVQRMSLQANSSCEFLAKMDLVYLVYRVISSSVAFSIDNN